MVQLLYLDKSMPYRCCVHGGLRGPAPCVKKPTSRIGSSLRADVKVKLDLAEGSGRLDLSECELEDIPFEVFELKDLEELSLAGNNLESIPGEIGRLTSLKRLQLSGNRLRHVPKEICNLESLKGLWLHGNILESLPEDIGCLQELEQLALAGNRLSTLPKSIGKLAQLGELVVAGNVITRLPEELGQLSALRNLDLHGNLLTSVPITIESLQNLEELWLQGNKSLESLPATLASLRTLKKLSVADCSLKNVPDELNRLRDIQDISLYGNCLENIPETILDAQNLKKLWLENNPLSCEGVEILLKSILQKEIACKVGMDRHQLSQGPENLVHACKNMILTSDIITNQYGYFKIENFGAKYMGDNELTKVVVVAFGSAPGVPNWGGALRRVRESLDKDAHHQNTSFDALFIVDPFRSWYGGGDTRYEDYWEPLKEATSKYEHVILLGDSMGATAALMYAELADYVHAFCPQINLSTSSIRPAEEHEWEGTLRERVLKGVSACKGSILVHVGNWHHDIQQSNAIPTSMEHARVKIYGVNSHRLAITLDKGGKLIPLLESTILNQLGIASKNVRLSNLF